MTEAAIIDYTFFAACLTVIVQNTRALEKLGGEIKALREKGKKK